MMSPAAALRARLFNPPNAKLDTGISMHNGWPVHGMARQAAAEPVQKVSAPTPPPALVAVNVYPVTFATHDRIIKTVCRIFEVRLSELLSERRNLKVSEARQVAMALTVRLTKHSMPKVGFLFDRDHTTVLHAVRKMLPHINAIEAHMPPDSIMEWVTTLKERLTSPEAIEARRVKFTNNRFPLTHCINGHPYDEQNTGHKPDGERYCRICTRERRAKQYLAQKQARIEA